MSPSSATKSSAPLGRACSACATDTSDPARSPSTPCSYASRGRARAASPSALAAAHVFPAQTWELESTEAIKQAAREGLGIAFLSRYAVAEEIERGELTSFRIAGRPPMERTLDVARLARRPFTPSERGFLDTLRTCCAGSRSLAAAVLPEAHG
jgi:DNA-binding transcriptional LysR family regulator